MDINRVAYLSIVFALNVLSTSSEQNITAQDQGICSQGCLIGKLFQDYDKRDLPEVDEPVTVSVALDLKEMYGISEITMDYSIKCFLRATWQDSRLQFADKEISADRNQIMLDAAGIKDKLWLPDLFFGSEKNTQSLHPDNMIDSNTLVSINASGHVQFVRDLTVTLKCEMDLRKYPLDEQKCGTTIESFRLTVHQMDMVWLDSLVYPSVRKSNLGSFIFESFETRSCEKVYHGDSFPCLEIVFLIQRKIGYFLMQLFLPSMLVVILSWITFWTEMDAGSQVSMQLLLILTVTTMNNGAQSSLPKVSYVKALDVWFLGCLVFVCLSLVESSVVNYIIHISSKPGQQYEDSHVQNAALSAQPKDTEHKSENQGNNNTLETNKNNTNKLKHKIDRISRVAFPAAFALFNVIYWWLYL